MHSMRLAIPACLSVTMLGCPSVVDPDDDTGTSTTSTTTTTTATATTASTTSTTSEDESSSSSTGPFVPPDCSVHGFVAECEDEAACAWRPELGGCVVDCLVVTEMTTCVGIDHCVWTNECEFPGPI